MDAVRVDGADALDVIGLVADFDRRVARLSFAEVTRGALTFLSERLALVRASVALVLEPGVSFRLYDVSMDLNGVEAGKVIPWDSASLGATLSSLRSVYRPNIRAWPHENGVDRALLSGGIHSTFSVPLLSGERALGTINAGAVAVDGISPTARQVMELLAPRLAFAIEVGRAHDALRESEARFRDIFETVGDSIVVATTSNRRIIMVNRTACEMLRRSREELLTLRVDDIHPEAEVDRVVKLYESMVRGEPSSALEVPMMRGDGTTWFADATARNTVIGGNRCVVGLFRDAAERRRSEAEQLQAQKLESIRTLAAGIAHDFNNLLTGVLGNVTLASSRLAAGHEAAPLLIEAERAATRAAGLTQQLLTFAKGGEPVRKAVDIAAVVREAAGSATRGTAVRCEFNFLVKSLTSLADEAQLTQAFQNVIRNAVEAMPDGGVVSIGLLQREVSGKREVVVSIADTGHGIPADLHDRIFMPFFSSKRGSSGLGLPVAYSIVRNHGGQIGVEPHPSGGTVFKITFPVVAAEPDVRRTDPLGKAVQGRVLVMDDEEMVLYLAARILGREGYVVDTVEDGRAAVERCEQALQRGEPFHAVVLDLTVPAGLGGKEAAEQILAMDPKARLVVSSGYSDDRVMSNYKQYGFYAVLPKPYTAKQLRDIIAEVLAEGIA